MTVSFNNLMHVMAINFFLTQDKLIADINLSASLVLVILPK